MSKIWSSRRRRHAAYVGTFSLFAAPLAFVQAATAPVQAATTVDIQILSTNDFHGHIAMPLDTKGNPNSSEAGAAVLAGAIKQFETANPNTSFVAAGDLIGASTFTSFVDDDKPTIDIFNAAGLDASAVGNHELDQGMADLTQRVMAPYDATTNPTGGANWQYLAANLKSKSGAPNPVKGSWIQDFGQVQVGYIGAVTEHLPELVSPAGISDVQVTNIATAANAEADTLKANGADVVVLLVHEGAADTQLASATNPAGDLGKIVNNISPKIDAVISAHTHLAYNHAVPVAAWQSEGRAVTNRPVVSAGSYGSNLNKLVFTVDLSGKVTAVTQDIVPLMTKQADGTYKPNFPADATTQAIVDKAVADAKVKGAVELGKITAPFNRAKLAAGTENRGGESTGGNLVAEVQRWATSDARMGGAQIAFMNPGGLRADMVGSGAYPAPVSYEQAATVQPFANTLVNVIMTGAQIKQALEQQWQPAGSSRPFLKLGASEGFSYTYDPTKAEGSRITQMMLNGKALDLASEYSVTVNSFLAAGGDNFKAFAISTKRKDTGVTDLQAMVDFMAQFASKAPLAPKYDQRAVGVTFPAAAPASYKPGDTVNFALSSLAFSTTPDLKDAKVSVSLGTTPLGDFTVDNTVGADPYDEIGKASVSFKVPAATPAGPATLTIKGATTGTTVTVPITIAPAPATATPTPTAKPTPTAVSSAVPAKAAVKVALAFSKKAAIKGKPAGRVTITVTGGATPTGTIKLTHPKRKELVGTLKDGKVTFTLVKFSRIGKQRFRALYLGDAAHTVGSARSIFVVKRPNAKATA